METEALPAVLIVDDDPDDGFFCRRLLMKGGVGNPIVTIDSGDQAMAFLRGAILTDTLPCVVFLDIKMPGENGFDVLQWAREQPALKNAVIYMLSSSDEPRDRHRAHELGASGYLVKYPRAEELVDYVQRGCGYAAPTIQTKRISA